MIKYDENGLVPAVIQDTQCRVLMLAYMNEEALTKTLQTGETWFYSRKRKEVWKKGEKSGNVQKVRRITADCDRDSLRSPWINMAMGPVTMNRTITPASTT